MGVWIVRFALLWGAVGTFVALWGWFFWVIWTADGAAELSAKAVYVASALGGVLGTFFAVALGIQRKDVTKDVRELRVGETLLGTPDTARKGIGEALATFALIAYAAVGVGALATVLFRSEQSPDSVETVATAFGGLVLVLFTAALAPGQERGAG